MDLLSAVVTLFLVMDPIGNIPLFLSVLRGVDPVRRRAVLVRENVFAYIVLFAFLLAGRSLLRILGLQPEAISVAGGIVLFLIAIRMVFPGQGAPTPNDAPEGEPFLVPLAVPLIAGPSTLATLLLLEQSPGMRMTSLVVALTIAWGVSGMILMSSTAVYRLLGTRGLIAMERLMGMLLVMVAVQMLMNGVTAAMHSR